MNRLRLKTHDSAQKEKKLQNRFWNKRELAQYLGISIFTVDAWVYQKRIPFVKIGGRKVVFDRNEIEKWIDEQRVDPILKEKGLDL